MRPSNEIWKETDEFFYTYFDRVRKGNASPYEMHGATGSFPLEYVTVFSHKLETYLSRREKSGILTIIDIGCSTGNAIRDLTAYIKEKGYNVRSIGIDPSPLVEKAVIEGNIDYGIRGVVQSLPLTNGCGDIVVCNKVLGRFKPEQKMLALGEISRVLKKDGILLVGKTFGDEMTEHLMNQLMIVQRSTV